MTAKFSASADGTKVNIGNAAEDALQIDSVAKTIEAVVPYTLASNGPAFSVQLSADQTGVVSGTWTKILFNTELFDTNNCFANYKFTPNVPGYYQINGSVSMNATAGITTVGVAIYKNGVILNTSSNNVPSSVDVTKTVSAVIYLNGTTDYVELFGIIVSGTGLKFKNYTSTSFSGALVRGA